MSGPLTSWLGVGGVQGSAAVRAEGEAAGQGGPGDDDLQGDRGLGVDRPGQGLHVLRGDQLVEQHPLVVLAGPAAATAPRTGARALPGALRGVTSADVAGVLTGVLVGVGVRVGLGGGVGGVGVVGVVGGGVDRVVLAQGDGGVDEDAQGQVGAQLGQGAGVATGAQAPRGPVEAFAGGDDRGCG
ncbi:MAG: hypothetical protein DCC50_11105, partial [Acidobacteria bacterium]